MELYRNGNGQVKKDGFFNKGATTNTPNAHKALENKLTAMSFITPSIKQI